MIETTMEEYDKLTANKPCRFCGGSLGAIEHYPHSGGWRVRGFAKRQWLYRTCMKCGHQWALNHLGVAR